MRVPEAETTPGTLRSWGAKTKPRSILTARSGPEPLDTRDPAPTRVFMASGGALDVVRTVPDSAGIEAAGTGRPSSRGGHRALHHPAIPGQAACR
jgi:hypothetical protein